MNEICWKQGENQHKKRREVFFPRLTDVAHHVWLNACLWEIFQRVAA